MTTRIRSVGVWTWTRLSIVCFVSALLLMLGMFFWAGYGLDSPGAQDVGLAIRMAVGIALAALVLTGITAAVLAVLAALRNGTVPMPELDGMISSGAVPVRRRLAVAAGFAAGNLALIAAGAAHILVWNPLAKVPGLELGELYEQMHAAGEGIGAGGMVAAWAVFWGLATVAYVFASAHPRLTAFFTLRRTAVLGLALVGATCFFHWFAGFNMGMSLADAFATSGGDAAWSGPLIALAGQLAFIAAMFLAVAPRRSPAPTARPSAA